MPIKIYNTLTRKKEILRPLKGRKVKMFVCGITSYDSPHLGHARTYLAFDLIVKYLKEKGYDVFYLQNITDIDDKIIRRAKEKKTDPKKIALRFEKEYLKDMKELKVNSVTKYARATDHVKEIISQVERLLKKGYAYQIKDGIYYNIAKFKNYGKLSGRTILQAEDAVSRIDESKEKINRGDFCLWKFSKEGEPEWESPWGPGRPGWHIEDTAIAEKYFGLQYDMHGGGKDLIFPHHEAEIAQMEGISGKSPMVKYWMHSGCLTVKGRKMAKSLGNFITVRDFMEKHSPRLLRFLIIKNHYRSPLDYNENAVLQAKRELGRIDESVERLKKQRSGTSRNLNLEKIQKRFEAAMEDDFNTPKAIAEIFELIHKANSLMDGKKLGKAEAEKILAFLKKIDKTLNVIFWPETRQKLPQGLLELVKEREKYRKEKNWKRADQIRREIERKNFRIKDTAKGPELKRIR